MVKSEESMSTEQKLQAHAIKRSCNLNLAAAYLKCKKYKDAMDAASQVSRLRDKSPLLMLLYQESFRTGELSCASRAVPYLSQLSWRRCLRKTRPA